jgi:hypothetical protein
MNGIAAYLVLALLTHSRVDQDDRRYDYPRPGVPRADAQAQPAASPSARGRKEDA